MDKYKCIKNYYGIKNGEVVSLLSDRDYRGIDMHTSEVAWYYFYRIQDKDSKNLNIAAIDLYEYFVAIK